MKYKEIVIMTITIIYSTLVLALASASAQGPARSIVDHTFDAKKEAQISELKRLHVAAVFNRLKSTDFRINEDFLNKAAYLAYENRKQEAVAYAMKHLTGPRLIPEGGSVSQNHDFALATKIVQLFPGEAVDSLLGLYDSADPVTKGNLIFVFGKVAGEQGVKNLLIEALDNKAVCDEQEPEIGEPMRICDVAYNQLVLRYRIQDQDVLRSIGPSYDIETRDYHIDILKSRL